MSVLHTIKNWCYQHAPVVSRRTYERDTKLKFHVESFINEQKANYAKQHSILFTFELVTHGHPEGAPNLRVQSTVRFGNEQPVNYTLYISALELANVKFYEGIGVREILKHRIIDMLSKHIISGGRIDNLLDDWITSQDVQKKIFDYIHGTNAWDERALIVSSMVSNMHKLSKREWS